MSRLSTVLAFVALLTLVVTTGATARRRADAPPVMFTDLSGDGGTAADITTVGVTNDDHGQYSLDIGFATPYPAAGALTVYLDTDMNPSTGDPSALGADYLLVDDNAATAVYFLKWSGTAWADAPTHTTVTSAAASDKQGVTLSVNKSELDNSTGFNFFVESLDGDGSDGHWDDGPSGVGSWQYRLRPLVELSVAASRSFAVKAGGTWTVVLVAGRSDTGGTLGPEGTIACHATSGATKLALVNRSFVSSGGSSSGSGAVCAFKVPKRLKHKALRGTITVSFEGQSVSQNFTQTVK
jgi:hypothetical protein